MMTNEAATRTTGLDKSAAEPATKSCGACQQNLPVEQFAYKVKARGLRHAKCRTCTSVYASRWHQENKARRNPAIAARSVAARRELRNQVHAVLAETGCRCGQRHPHHLTAVLTDPQVGGRRLSDLISAGWAPTRLLPLVRAAAAAGRVVCDACRSSAAGHLHGLSRQVKQGAQPGVTKHCGGCRQVRPLEDFAMRNTERGTRQSQCRDCHRSRRTTP